jgi:molybdopterin converting factor small subunit
MDVKIELSAVLRRFTDNASEIIVNAVTVGEALSKLTERYPTLRTSLYTDAGHRRSYICVFLNLTDIRSLRGEATTVGPGDCVLLLPSVAGG